MKPLLVIENDARDPLGYLEDAIVARGSEAAHALGGRAYGADRPEVRVLTPQLSDEGGRDPMGAPLAKPVVTFHQDTFDVPPGATVLARSDRFTQAFRCGSALAIQPHPEVSADRVESWLPRTELPQMAGVDGADMVQAMRNSVDPADASMLFTAWLDQITAPIS